MKKELVKKILAYISSIILILVIWLLYALYIKAPLILPLPSAVLENIVKLAESKSFYINFTFSFLRILIAFLISVGAGLILGFLCSISSFFQDLLQFPLLLLRITPVIAVILLALFWFNSNTVPVFVTVLMSLPVMITAVEKGLDSNNSENTEKLLYMAETYNFSKYEIYRYILIPQSKASILAGIENCFGLCWKVTLAGEVLSLPQKGCGSLLQKAQVHLETSQVMAITILLIFICFIFQTLLKLTIGKGNKND